jgi:hypothetical protein
MWREKCPVMTKADTADPHLAIPRFAGITRSRERTGSFFPQNLQVDHGTAHNLIWDS